MFDTYTADIRNCRSSHILTGLPDAYGRGRIIGDYRRVALYGVARLIERKQEEKRGLDLAMSTDEIIRDREELSEQIRALEELQQMASKYGFDISVPARTSREAVQWLYFAYLAAVKEQNGAAMSLGRTSTFLDIYFERDLASGAITEQQAQEIIDDFVIKLRIVRFLRTPAGYAQAALLAPLCPGAGTNQQRRRYFAVPTFAAGLGNIERVDVLSFHPMGRFKWEERARSMLCTIQSRRLMNWFNVCAANLPRKD